MPYADPKDKQRAMKRWRKDVISKGYGRWLYARRKLRFDDAERFRAALQEIGHLTGNVEARRIAYAALEESRKAEEALGPWVADADEA